MQSPIVLARNLSTKAENFQQPIKQIGGVHSFVSSFQLAINPYLSVGKLPISLASEILNINVRTIQRRFGKRGSDLQSLGRRDDARADTIFT